MSQKKYQISKTPDLCSNDSCGKRFSSMKRKCDECSSPVITQTKEERFVAPEGFGLLKTTDIGQKVNINKPAITMGEPVLVNPNSFETVKAVLDEYKLIHKIGTDSRQWVLLGCDGPPYRLASKIIEENKSDYDWVSLVPGLGHLHMNQLKSIFKVLDKIMLEPLGKEVLNFESLKAFDYFIRGKRYP